jgi:hypothetical protein
VRRQPPTRPSCGLESAGRRHTLSIRPLREYTSGIDTTWLGYEEQLHGAAIRCSSFAPASLRGRTRLGHVALFGRPADRSPKYPSTTTSPLGSLHHHRCPALARTWPQLRPVCQHVARLRRPGRHWEELRGRSRFMFVLRCSKRHLAQGAFQACPSAPLHANG